MDDKISGKIAGIICYPQKGGAGTPLQHAALFKDSGMDGDCHSGPGDRQLTLLSRETKEWMNAQAESGLCFSRFKENLSIDGIPMKQLRVGTRLTAGTAVLEISAQNKRCHPECRLFAQGHTCRLTAQSVFARVIRSGTVRVGDKIGGV